MATIGFDTFKFVERLEKAGLSREQAVAISEAQRDTFAEALDNQLATKADIVALDRKIEKLDSKIEAIELRLTVKLGAMLVVMAGVIIAVLKL